MSVGGTLQQLGGFVAECEQAADVDTVELAECNNPPGRDGLSADVELVLSAPPGESMTPCAASLNADGTVRVGFETAAPVLPTSDYGVDVEPSGARLDDDGRLRVVLCVSVGESAASDNKTATVSTPSDATEQVGQAGSPASDAGDRDWDQDQDRNRVRDRDRDLPPFKNPDLLQSVYESCDTFAEMADTLDMDVTAETVRRYMIDFDIHEPNSYDTSGRSEDAADPGDEEPVVLSDGIGLPEDITVETLIETVKQSNTIYEVKRDIGVGREDALEMLRELNLLDLVVGRLATEAERDISREDVVDRLREASAVQ